MKSVDAFTEAASGNPAATGIQVGFYEMQTQMKAEDALAILVDPANLTAADVTIPEGLRVVDIVGLLAKNTDYSKKQFEKALADTATLGLPGLRRGQPRGLPVPGDVRVRPADAARRHAQGDGRPLAPGGVRHRPRGQGRGARLHAARDDDDRQPARGRGSRRLHAEDRPRDLQPPGQPGQRSHQRAAADRRHGQLRAGSLACRGAHDRGHPGRLAVQHLQVPRAAAGTDRGALGKPRSRRRSTRTTATGCST